MAAGRGKGAGCGGGLAKFILVTFNLLLFLAGLVPFIFGIIAVASSDTLTKLVKMIPGTDQIEKIVDLTELIKSGAVYFIVIGVIIGVIGFLGCFGACCEAKCLLYLYLTLLILIVLAEVAVIIVAVAAPEVFSREAQNVMKASLKEYKYDCIVNTTTTKVSCREDVMSMAWNTMQYELSCCGAKGYEDYNDGSAPKFEPRISLALAPLTCCVIQDKNAKFDPVKVVAEGECMLTGMLPTGYYTKGCFEALLLWMTTTAAVIGVMAAIGALELILIVLTIVQLRNIGQDKKY